MEFEIRLIAQREEWENFVLRQKFSLFIQSGKYGEFYTSLGEEYWIFGIYRGNNIVGGTLVLSTHAKRGRFLYLPYGPILPEQGREEAFRMLLHSLVQHAQTHQYDFIRVSPFLPDQPDTHDLFVNFGFKDAPMHILAETTWMLDIQKPEEVLLSEMKKNHRNLIRRCIKEGVSVRASTSKNDVFLFNTMLDATVDRHQFRRFSSAYVEKEFLSFANDNQAMLFQAYLPDGRLDSSAIIMFFGNMAAYRHGASYGLDKRLPTSYLLQWEAIREAKKRGILWYNFWGIAPEGSSAKHPFHGITHFKKGFGGSQIDLLHCQDLPISWKYSLNWIIESFRKMHRGF